MKKLPGIGKFRGMPMARALLRKPRKCKECRVEMPKGAGAYRPMLDAEVGGIIRCDRVCDVCMAAEADFLPGS